MKTTPPSKRLLFLNRSLLLASSIAIGLALPSLTQAANGTWTSGSSGNWSTSGNWSGGTVADGANFSALFNTIDLTSDVAVHLDSSRAIGALNFSDTGTGTLFSYTLDNNSNPANILTLEGATPTTAGTITVANGNTATISLVLAGAGLTKANGGSGTLILTGNNTYGGVTTISGGTAGFIQINANAALGASTLFISAANGGLRYGAAFNDLRDIEFGANGGRIDTGAFNVTYSSNITGTVAAGSAFTKLGSGTLTLSGNNTLAGAGGVSVSGGFLQIDSNARLGNTTGALTLNSGGGIRYGAAFNSLRAITIGNGGGVLDTNGFSVTYSSAISAGGTGGLTKQGTGTLRLTSDSNAYTGATVVSAGTLLINGNQTAATGAVSVANGATLGGTGTVGGATSIANGGTLSPGDGTGTLTLNSSLALASGSIYSFQGGDLVAVNGALSLNSNWVLSLGGGLANGGSVTIFTFGSLGTVSLTPTFDISQLGFTPTGPLSLSQVGNTIVLNGVQAVPEPSTYALIMVGLGAMVWVHRARRRVSVK